MEVTKVESIPISIPLSDSAVYGTNTVDARNYALAYVQTSDGTEGVAHTLAYNGAKLIAQAVEEILAPMVEGKDPHNTEQLWQEMFEGTITIGRKGVLLRAISLVDIALWDIKAKTADQPLYKYLGAYTDEVSVYSSGGYYRDNDRESLRAEMERNVQRGHDAVKMKVGRLSPTEDAERIEVVRDVIGPERTLFLDANGAYSNKPEALAACRKFAPYNPYFIEEPVMPDSIKLMAAVNDAIDFSVATGELEFNRYGFMDLMSQEAVDIIQTDATVVGGITEWLRVAHTAASFDIPVVPHWNFNLHAHLIASIQNGPRIEYFHRDVEIRVIDDIINEPLKQKNGKVSLPDRPGHGIAYDQELVDQFRLD